MCALFEAPHDATRAAPGALGLAGQAAPCNGQRLVRHASRGRRSRFAGATCVAHLVNGHHIPTLKRTGTLRIDHCRPSVAGPNWCLSAHPSGRGPGTLHAVPRPSTLPRASSRGRTGECAGTRSRVIANIRPIRRLDTAPEQPLNVTAAFTAHDFSMCDVTALRAAPVPVVATRPAFGDPVPPGRERLSGTGEFFTAIARTGWRVRVGRPTPDTTTRVRSHVSVTGPAHKDRCAGTTDLEARRSDAAMHAAVAEGSE
jgi:hypothetical protein